MANAGLFPGFLVEWWKWPNRTFSLNIDKLLTVMKI